MNATLRATILGGGLCGNLLAICLARRGLQVDVYERQSQAQYHAGSGGRSINLALAARGIAALERFGALEAIRPLLLPMRGRMLHEPGADERFVPYGGSGECIYSVSRSALNRALYDIAMRRHAVAYHFDAGCTGLDRDTLEPIVTIDGRERRLAANAVFAADGAGSVVRRTLGELGRLLPSETLLDHGYKELTIAPRLSEHGPSFALSPEALHIWPRGEFMLIALPNTDATFTATLFLARRGEPSFESIGPENVRAFFAAQFPDALPLIERLEEQFAENPDGILGTVRCSSWHAQHCLLLGDAAHAIVPFHGQGMNAAFEDIVELDALLEEPDAGLDWPQLFGEFERRRIPNTDAIADMALENYLEMRASVRDPGFLLQRELALELERRFPERFASRYAMVMFRPDIPYAQARERGAAQTAILQALTRQAQSLADVDFTRAAALVADLPRLGQSAAAR